MDDKTIKAGKVIRKLRKRLDNVSQERLGFRANLNRNFIGEIERDEATPTLDTVYKIAKGLRMKPSELMREIEESLDEKDKFWLYPEKDKD